MRSRRRASRPRRCGEPCSVHRRDHERAPLSPRDRGVVLLIIGGGTCGWALAAANVPPDKLRIVGQGLRIVRRSDRTFRSIMEAGVVGAAVGGLIIVLAAMFGLGDALAEAVTVTALLLGAVCGLAAGTTAFVATRTPLLGADARLYAERYDLAADPTVAERAALEIDSVSGETSPPRLA